MPDVDPVKPQRPRAIVFGACLLFLAYAGSFLYFFVDDEAIPLVYAHNLLRGRGLSYTALEGRVEGYSDLLHVLWSTVVLTITRGLGFTRLAPLLVGKAVSLTAGVLVIVVTAGAMARAGVRRPAMVAGLAFLCLAGPLAVWSASSLETVIVALTVLAFALATWDGWIEAAVLLGILIALERIDGPVYIACVIIAALVAEPRHWRRIARIGALIALGAAAYHAWRVIYFGSLLSAPLAAKVLHRLTLPAHVIAKTPAISYLPGLIGVYGWTGLILLAAAGAMAIRTTRGRAAIVVLVLLGVYVERVDDWMFGWRFTVAMAPFVALVLAIAIDRLPRRAAMLAAAAVCAWSVVSAHAFLRFYVESERRPIFWLAPRGGEMVWLGRYGELLASSRRLMRAGDRIAFNQAGLIPYMLDLENIDDLGICSRFVARLPTTDVVYTGVGRYSSLTTDPIIRTAHAYLLYQNVKFMIVPRDLLLKANHEIVPELLLDGAFSRVPDESLHDNVIYQRTGKPEDRFARDPSSFAENVAHYSRVLSGAIDGHALGASDLGPELPFLREVALARHFTRSLTFDVTFGAADELVTDLYMGNVSARTPAKLVISLSNAGGQSVYSKEFALTDAGARVLEPLPVGTRASALSIAVEAPGDNELRLTDLRVQGQTSELHAYVRRNLRFPAAGW